MGNGRHVHIWRPKSRHPFYIHQLWSKELLWAIVTEIILFEDFGFGGIVAIATQNIVHIARPAPMVNITAKAIGGELEPVAHPAFQVL